MNALEERLARLDLQLAPVGEHLPAETVAAIAQGAEASGAAAAHLAACDECTDLLVATGAGLEAALVEVPGAEAWVQPHAAPAASGRLGLLLGGGALVVSAVALWVALSDRAPDAPPAPTRSAVVSLASASHPSARPTSRAPVEVSRPSIPTPPVAVALESAAPVAPVTAAPKRVATGRTPDARRPDARMRVRGPRAFDARPVDGPPRGNGYLRLATKPPAKVYIDGRFVRWTPLVDHRLIEGPHDIRLVYESPQAKVAEERFRVLIEPDRIWRAVRRNIKP